MLINYSESEAIFGKLIYDFSRGMSMFRKYLFILSILFLASNVYGAVKLNEIEVIRTAYKTDQYKYYIVGVEKQSNAYDVSLKRVSSGAMMFYKMQLKCSPRAYKVLGSSGKSTAAIKANYSGSWNTPLIGSIEVDVITTVCR